MLSKEVIKELHFYFYYHQYDEDKEDYYRCADLIDDGYDRFIVFYE